MGKKSRIHLVLTGSLRFEKQSVLEAYGVVSSALVDENPSSSIQLIKVRYKAEERYFMSWINSATWGYTNTIDGGSEAQQSLPRLPSFSELLSDSIPE